LPLTPGAKLQRPPPPTPPRAWRRGASQLWELRRPVYDPPPARHAPARRDEPRCADEERHAQAVVVEVPAVLEVVVVLAEALAVVGGEHEDHPVPQVAVLELLHDRTHVVVGEADLGVVARPVGGRAAVVADRLVLR